MRGMHAKWFDRVLLQDAKWDQGVVTKDSIPDEAFPTDEIAASKEGTRPGRLYFTDGTSPNYDELGKPAHIPGAASPSPHRKLRAVPALFISFCRACQWPGSLQSRPSVVHPLICYSPTDRTLQVERHRRGPRGGGLCVACLSQPCTRANVHGLVLLLC